LAEAVVDEFDVPAGHFPDVVAAGAGGEQPPPPSSAAGVAEDVVGDSGRETAAAGDVCV
jgi:hypothetical protein